MSFLLPKKLRKSQVRRRTDAKKLIMIIIPHSIIRGRLIRMAGKWQRKAAVRRKKNLIPWKQ